MQGNACTCSFVPRMNYEQTINYLFTTLPMFSRMGPAAYKKDLTNIKLLCQHLGQPQQQFKTIHVGGTNGKGSVSHALAAVLQKGDYKCGLHTSPHLKDFRERIKINGALVPEAFVVDFVADIKPQIEEIKPSFFEITVAMAFAYFAQQKVDVAIIEVGLGGRLDSTNIIQPELSVITNIGMDHTALLGNTMEAIAGEKAGIIKKKTPVVIGERHPQTETVFINAALQNSAPITFAEDNFTVTQYELNIDNIRLWVKDKSNVTETAYTLDLPGIYQTKNLLTVLQAIRVLQEIGFTITDDVVANALREVKISTGLHGRWEVVHYKPAVVLEVAHNTEGIQQMLAHLQQLTFGKLHLIIGFAKDKEIEDILSLLPKEATFYFTHAHIPRALPADALQQTALNHHLKGIVYDDVNKALQQALTTATKEDLIIVCGSIFLVAEVNIDALKIDNA